MTKYDINERMKNKRTKMNRNGKQCREDNRLCNLEKHKTERFPKNLVQFNFWITHE